MLRRLLLVPVALAFAAPGTEISFGPEEGLELTKTCDYELDMELSEFNLSFNGEEMELEEAPEGTNSTRGHLVVVDTYDSVGGGRATKLARRFEEATRRNESSGSGGDSEEDDESPLQGLTVVFTWDGDAEEYGVAFGPDDEDADEDLLEGLEAEIDFRAFLPDGEVDEGDSWTVDPSEFGAMFEFGGELKYDDDEDDTLNRLFNEALDENLTGDITCTFAGTREEDGRTLAVIEITVDGEGEAEDSETQELGETGYDIEVTTAVEAELELAGQLVWDVSGGHFASLRLEGDLEFTTSETGSADLDGQGFEQVVEMGFAGTVVFSFEAE